MAAPIIRPAPYQLRSVETSKVQRLWSTSHIGRSHRLHPDYDLIIRHESQDVSGHHATIRCRQSESDGRWQVDLEPKKPRNRGMRGEFAGALVMGPRGVEKRSPHFQGGGTSVDGELVKSITPLEIGNVIRFGWNELWILEGHALYPKSNLAPPALGHAKRQAMEDPKAIMELTVPNAQAHWALQRCDKWISLIRVVLEWLDEPDEPPCADRIEIKDELGNFMAVHEVSTLEEMEHYDMKPILKDISLGRTIRLRLCSDPPLLAPMLQKLEKARLAFEAEMSERDEIPDDFY